MSEEREETTTLDKILGGLTVFDWITPLAQWMNDARGMVTCYGTRAEIHQLKANGITVHMPMFDIATGNYLWQLTKADYQRAKRIIGDL